MLRIYPVLLDLVRDLRPVVLELERKDPDLARQCRRALASGPLNVAEGSYSRGGNRVARYHTALGSLREVPNECTGTLWKVANPLVNIGHQILFQSLEKF